MKRSFLRENKNFLIIIFLTSIIFRLIFALPVFATIEKAIGPGSDAKNYIVLAKHLIEKQEFSVYPEETGYREAARTPGYPLFIVFSFLLSGARIWSVILLQCFLDACIAVLVFSIALLLFQNVTSALLAGILYTVHPHQSLYTTQILSEILFTFFIVISLASFIFFLKKNTKVFLAFSGIFLGIATLTRPISFYFFIPILFILFLAFRKKIRTIAIQSIIFLVSFFLVLTPWYVRNYSTYRRIFLSTIGNWNIGYYNAAFVIASKERMNLREAQSIIEEAVKKRYGISNDDYTYASDNPEICAQIASYGFEVIRKNPGRYAVLHMIGFLHTFVPMEYTFLYKLLGKQGIERVGETTAISKAVISDTFRGRFASMFRTIMNERFRKFPWWFTTIWFAFSLFQLLIYFLALRGFAHFWKQQKILFLFFLLTIIYFAILPGPVGDARFRVPIEPILVLLAGAGLASKKASEPEKRRIGE
ncbi:MAG: glycosyltransferase family 39 protein [Candidatus Cloacimonadota bacterium]|nr:MAG: glycosyltransferase family 39 protein [Candidatus Cloacimonadota bacterium]